MGWQPQFPVIFTTESYLINFTKEAISDFRENASLVKLTFHNKLKLNYWRLLYGKAWFDTHDIYFFFRTDFSKYNAMAFIDCISDIFVV
jgi:hypothetical protein